MHTYTFFIESWYSSKILWWYLNKIIKFINILDKKAFADKEEIDAHVKIIEDEKKLSDKDSRMVELKNWLDFINEN